MWLSSARVPSHVAERDPNIPSDLVTKEFLNDYDRDTLWYDIFWHNGRVIAVAPLLVNFQEIIRTATIELDGRRVTPRIKNKRRYSQIEFRCPTPPQEISLTYQEWRHTGPVSRAERDRYKGRNGWVALNKDNHPDWVRDHARFHRVHHGLNAVVLFDNNSEQFTVADYERAYRDAGIEVVKVLTLPFKYGAFGPRGYTHNSKFLQSAALNLARQRYLGDARAVLVCDIDELVTPGSPGSRSVFDVAHDAFWKFTSVNAHNVFPAQDLGRAARHADHIWRADPPSGRTHKYCVSPRGLLRHAGWDVHKPDIASIDPYLRHKEFKILHCQGTSTNWKGFNKARTDQALVPDTDAIAAFECAGLIAG